MKTNPFICIAGQNKIAVNGLKLVIQKFGKENILVCPNKNDRGKSNWQPSLKKFAKELGVRIVKLEELYLYKNLVLISLECSQIIDIKKFKSRKIYNLHFSLLPKYRGVYTSSWPIINQEKKTGITIHKVNQKIDCGNIIFQKFFLIKKKDTARDLYLKYSKYGYDLLKKYIYELVFKNLKGSKQKKGGHYYSKSSINYKSIKLDLFQPAKNFESLVRSLHFREFQLPKINGVYIKNGKIKKKLNKTGTIIKKIFFIRLSCIDFDIQYQVDNSLIIFQLIKKKNFKLAIDLIKKDKSLLNITNNKGWSPLMIAAYNGYNFLAKELIKLGANVNQANQNGTTILMYAKDFALQKKNFYIFKLLLNNGAKLTKRNKFKKNIFDYVPKNKINLLKNLT